MNLQEFYNGPYNFFRAATITPIGGLGLFYELTKLMTHKKMETADVLISGLSAYLLARGIGGFINIHRQERQERLEKKLHENTKIEKP